ncbi:MULTISPECIES: hypothetical protein [Kitasatospora]|uniref:Uncharacterized protein n=2 Tax=Kitasatospora TaxID=2063 RepID=A0ABT1J7N8_9ACTN|nr:hypothetical protein [Kitasatospora paracochleata]MCP2313066.1 hypothetical protein [Kitasatospora paracochleata]
MAVLPLAAGVAALVVACFGVGGDQKAVADEVTAAVPLSANDIYWT